MDYAGLHYQPVLILEMAADGIFIVFFPKKTTKFMQTADQCNLSIVDWERQFGCELVVFSCQVVKLTELQK